MHQVALTSDKPQPPLAVGAHYTPELATTVAGTATPTLQIESADPRVLAVDGTRLVAKAPGSSAVLITTDDGSVIDFLQLWVAPVTHVALTRRSGERIDGALGLAIGEDVAIVPALYNGAQRLGGDVDATWTSSDDAVAILRDGSRDGRRVRAMHPGTATVTIALGETTTTLDVEVVQ